MITASKFSADIFFNTADALDNKELKSFYFDLSLATMKFFDDYEIFLSDFVSIKKKIKNEPKKIELYLRNITKYDNHRGMLILLYRYKIFENKLKNTDEKFLLDMPEKFNEEWTDFNENYKYELVRVGTEVMDGYVEKIDGILEKTFKDDELFVSFFPAKLLKHVLFDTSEKLNPREISEVYDIAYRELEILGNSIENYGGDEDSIDYDLWHSLKAGIDALDFVEKNIIGQNFTEAISRWQQIPTIKIPKRVREKEALLFTFNQIVKSFAIGNNLAVITLCRSTFELVMFKYYGGETKSKPGNDPKLREMINFASENYYIDKPMCIEQCSQMNRIVHNLKGRQPSNERTLGNIKFIKYLIENIKAPLSHSFLSD